jgi:hypothetical protein
VLSGHSYHLSLRPTDFTHIGVPAALRSVDSSHCYYHASVLECPTPWAMLFDPTH